MAAFSIVASLFLLAGIAAYASFFYKSSLFGKTIWQVNTSKKIIALTFDDGPNEPFTSKIADIVESYNGKATFFVVGKNCLRFPGVAKSMQKRGHQIGAHSYSHAFHKYITQPRYTKELNKTTEVLATQGVKASIFRFPWLFRTPLLLKSVKAYGYSTPISGQFAHPLEPFQINAKIIAKHTLKIAKPGSIIIFHDGFNAKLADRTQTLHAVEIVTKVLHKQGYKFVTIDELLKEK